MFVTQDDIERRSDGLNRIPWRAKFPVSSMFVPGGGPSGLQPLIETGGERVRGLAPATVERESQDRV